MSSMHTPGSWFVPLEGGQIWAQGGRVIAHMDEAPCHRSRAEERLIAAAPDLRAACDALVKAAGHGNQGWAMLSEAVGLARAALAKAEGET